MRRHVVVDDHAQDKKGRPLFQKLDTYLKDKCPRYPSGTFIFEPEFTLPECFLQQMELLNNPAFSAQSTFRLGIIELLPGSFAWCRLVVHIFPMKENKDQ